MIIAQHGIKRSSRRVNIHERGDQPCRRFRRDAGGGPLPAAPAKHRGPCGTPREALSPSFIFLISISRPPKRFLSTQTPSVSGARGRIPDKRRRGRRRSENPRSPPTPVRSSHRFAAPRSKELLIKPILAAADPADVALRALTSVKKRGHKINYPKVGGEGPPGAGSQRLDCQGAIRTPRLAPEGGKVSFRDSLISVIYVAFN